MASGSAAVAGPSASVAVAEARIGLVLIFISFILVFLVLFVGLCVVSALCVLLFVSLNYVLFIMAFWPVTIKN